VTDGQESSESAAWQKKLLPLMQWMLVSLTAFFVVATLFQAYIVEQRIDALGAETFEPAAATAGLSPDAAVRVRLEAYALRMRYQHSGLILMSRAWVIYLGFVTGMILSLVGAAFILGKILTPESTLEIAKHGSLKTSSPGLVMTALGTALMISTMVMRADVTVTDAALYLPAIAATPSPPPSELKDAGKAGGKPNDAELDAISKEVERRGGRGK
jgi:hypothetical protein